MSLELSGTTGVKGVAGSVSAPSIVGDDTNTGISFPSADTIKFSTGGVERFAISNSGLSGDGSGLTGISAGITEADQWRVTSNFSISGAGDIASNWERNDNHFDKIGTGMSESSGIFTFPSTGIWRIVACFNANASNMQYAGVNIKATIDNSSYSEIGQNYDSATGTAYFMSIVADAIFDCTNTTTHKVKFAYNTQGNTTFEGESSKQRSGATFIRLGDT